MSDAPQLATPFLEVTLDDGTVYDVRALNPDLLAYDRTAAKHGWPTYNAKGELQAPFLWLTFLAWSASKRAAKIPADLSWDDFATLRCVQVRNVDRNGNGTDAPETVVPFQPEAEAE